MSCNGCRILRKGCNENCILRQSLQGIESSHAQANATVFVAKFFGRAGLMSFLSSVPESQRPALFQSLLFEACGRTVNPVHGAVGLLWTGNWHVCQSAVETVLKGGVLRPLPEYTASPELDSSSEANNVDLFRSQSSNFRSKRKIIDDVAEDLDLGLTTSGYGKMNRRTEKRRAATPSLNSDESDTTTLESGFVYQQNLQQGHETKLLRLFF
ncbi:LOB domain-containing protein 37-like [Lycium ferocissimum]|uniref:LOB domain-containing protein 37-like n=1 Tax=Lycium ferocissimum TaxID=112874 RepID=UPI0028151B78|nr:LOB domain-containing protein 37-like [Lycium ferocissimum]